MRPRARAGGGASSHPGAAAHRPRLRTVLLALSPAALVVDLVQAGRGRPPPSPAPPSSSSSSSGSRPPPWSGDRPDLALVPAPWRRAGAARPRRRAAPGRLEPHALRRLPVDLSVRPAIEGEAPLPGRRPLLVFAATPASPTRCCRSCSSGTSAAGGGATSSAGAAPRPLHGHRRRRHAQRLRAARRRRRRQEAGSVARSTRGSAARRGGDLPEGTRFTSEKRASRIERLRARGPSEDLALAEELRYTLSPLRRGALSLLARNPGCDLLVIAHTGLERPVSFGSLCRGRWSAPPPHPSPPRPFERSRRRGGQRRFLAACGGGGPLRGRPPRG